MTAAASTAASFSCAKFAFAQSEFTEDAWAVDGLSGTFVLPRDDNPNLPSILIIPGSGPTDRDGNSGPIRASTYRLIAHGLAQNGIRSLRYDKRGVGTSAPGIKSEDELRFDHFVGDAEKLSNALKEKTKSKRVVLLGHSEGGIIALRAASRAEAAGLILLATPGRPMRAILQEQLLSAQMPAQLRDQALKILDRLAKGETAGEVPEQLSALFRPSVQPYLASLLPIDPAAELQKLKMPVLLVQGDRDLQVTVSDFNTLLSARRDAKSLRLRLANHVFKIAPEERKANLQTYIDPARPLDPELVPAIVDFVKSL